MTGSLNIGGKQVAGSPNAYSSGSPNLFYDVKNSVLFRRDDQNIAYEVTSTQLPALSGVSIVDLYLTSNHIREPHWHPNAGELNYVISGEVNIAVLDPFTPRLLTYHAKPGQVVFLPMGWWHWITTVSEEAHVLVIFNNERPESIEGSDVLRKTPPEVFQAAYEVNSELIEKTLQPITNTVFIGPETSNISSTRKATPGPPLLKHNETILNKIQK